MDGGILLNIETMVVIFSFILTLTEKIPAMINCGREGGAV